MSNEPINELRTESINLRVEPRFKEKLAKAAQKERRSVSNLVMKILSDWLEKKE